MLLHPLNSHLLILPPFELPPLEGWGGTDQVTEIGGRWNFKENKCHINSLELQAAFFYLKAFCKNKTRLHMLLKLDNTTAVAYINKIGGTISASCNKLAKDIWNWAKGQDIWITASHVPGIKYTTADLRSHLFYDNKEWSLNEKVAKSLFDRFGKPVIDLFASYLNTKCTKYALYKPNPDAYHVNAFSLCWLDLNSYIFPPFSIVGRVLANLAQDRATALVIVPCWETQPWFPQFVRLVKPGTTPLLIPAHQHLLQLPGTNFQHPIWDRLSLVAAILLGTSQQQDCHLTLPRSWRVSTQSAYNTPVRRWLEFFNRWQLNPYQPTVSQVLDFLHCMN